MDPLPTFIPFFEFVFFLSRFSSVGLCWVDFFLLLVCWASGGGDVAGRRHGLSCACSELHWVLLSAGQLSAPLCSKSLPQWLVPAAIQTS